MRKAKWLLAITFLVIISVTISKAQAPTINLHLLQTATLDFAAFALGNDLTNQPRIMEISIFPTGVDVKVRISVDWKKNNSPSFVNIGSFTTNVFKSRSFSNTDIGQSEIEIPSGASNYNSSLLEENVKLGKPSGVYRINIQLLSPNGNLLSSASGQLEFLNPTEPTLLLPIEGNSYDIGTILVTWTPSAGASSYKILANYKGKNQGKEEALNSSNPLVNNKDVGNNTSVNLGTILDRELLSDTTIVIVVKAVIQATGGSNLLSSPIVTFKTNSTGTNKRANENQNQVDPKILQLANWLQGKVQQQFVNDLRAGNISSDEIQITDQDNPMSIDELLELISSLTAFSESLISVQFSTQ